MIFQEHIHAPDENHAEGKDEEEGASLGDGEQLVEITAGEKAYSGQNDDDDEKSSGALHHDDLPLAIESGGGQQGPGEERAAENKRNQRPAPWDVEGGHGEHAEPGGHSGGRNEDLFHGHGGAAFADKPENDGDGSDKGGNRVVGGGNLHR